jgi:hypothetical protein
VLVAGVRLDVVLGGETGPCESRYLPSLRPEPDDTGQVAECACLVMCHASVRVEEGFVADGGTACTTGYLRAGFAGLTAETAFQGSSYMG